ncbi:MAG: hypothetical protein DVB31_04630 [Verrucomicrobia bacterium]|nr:MAG: hypothetical protein DVB31_04630 [Verrucomicrobiota bacterium]
MFRFLAVVLGAIVLAAAARADGPDDQFIVVYNLIQQGDKAADRLASYRLYAEALDGLRRIQKGYPAWNERVINYRLRYCADKLAALQDVAVAAVRKPDAAQPAAGSGEPPGEVLAQLTELNGQIRALASDKRVLEAKLREALTAQPAPIDPRELHAAVDKIAALQSTNRVLLTKLESQEGERKNLVDKVVAEEAQKALAETRRQLGEQKQAAARLEQERAEVEGRLRRLQTESLQPLKLENQTLKDQVAELRSDTEKGRQVADLSARLTKVQSGLEGMKRANERLAVEKGALEKQLEDLRTRQAEEGIVKISRLETELAVARADAERNVLRADQLTTSLAKEKQEHARAEQEAQTLEQRVSQLAARSAADSEALKTLETTLAAEKSERANVEARLKAAEARAQAVAATAPSPALPAASPTTEQELQATAARAEVARLQESLRLSARRETEMQSALAQESALRARLEREKGGLQRQLAEANATIRARVATPREVAAAGTTPPMAKLEGKVLQLEKERDELKQRLSRLSVQATHRLAEIRLLPAITPRDRAVEFRLQR